MPDFLTRLVERTLGRAEVVRPSIAPLFAPGASLPAEASVEPLHEEPLGPARRPRSAAFQTASPPGPPTTTDREPASPPDPPSATRPSEQSRPYPHRPLVPPPAIAPARLLGPGASSAAPADRQDTVGPLNGPPAADRTPPAPGSVEPAPLRFPLVGQHPAETLPKAPDSAVRVRRGEAQTGPTVRVTIGRVEVRAVFPPPPRPVAEPAAPGPALTLDEYLKQRREGRR